MRFRGIKMSISKISTDKAPAAIGPYSQAIRTEGLIFVSGQLPVDGGVLQTEIGKATAASLNNIKNILEKAGSDMSKIVKTTVLLSSMDDFAAMNKVYESFFTAPFPARACFAVKQLPKNACVEIECVAEA